MTLLWLMMSSRTAALFSLRAVDSETGRGVPRVTFTTTYESSWITDSNGYVAISTLGIEGETLWFAAAADGYEAKADAFGDRGLHASITSGGSATLNVERTQIAERLYRQTGFGRYYDSIALGDATLLPSQTVQVNSGVMGQDSILCTVFNGAVRWFWGDTKRFAYPLGNFESTGATSCIPRTAPSCTPAEIDVSLAYFNRTLDGADFVAPMASIEPVDFPTWIGGLTVVPDSGPLAVDGVAMSASYVKPDHTMTPTQVGLIGWSEKLENFSTLLGNWSLTHPLATTGGCCGQPVTNRATPISGVPPTTTVAFSMDGDVPVRYVVFAGRGAWPLVGMRCLATLSALADINQYEAYTPLLPTSSAARPVLDRDPATGGLRWMWRTGAPLFTATVIALLETSGDLKPNEAPRARIYEDGDATKPLTVAGGSVHWNAFRRRYIAIFGCNMNTHSDNKNNNNRGAAAGNSNLGELFYAEALEESSAPPPVSGPLVPGQGSRSVNEIAWSNATRVVTHATSGMSCYNPLHLPMFDDLEGQRIYLSCTMVTSYSTAKVAEGRYDYNNMMFGLNISNVLRRRSA